MRLREIFESIGTNREKDFSQYNSATQDASTKIGGIPHFSDRILTSCDDGSGLACDASCDLFSCVRGRFFWLPL